MDDLAKIATIRAALDLDWPAARRLFHRAKRLGYSFEIPRKTGVDIGWPGTDNQSHGAPTPPINRAFEVRES